MVEITQQERAALAQIAIMTDPEPLKKMIANAQRLKSATVEAAAFNRLCFVQPEATPGTVEHDVWQAIHALEHMLSEERGKTTRLSRTRQKIARHGEAKTASDLTLRPDPSQGFLDLVQRKAAHLSFEAVALRHPKTFSPEVLQAAETRLASEGIDTDTLTDTSEGS